MCCGLAIVMRLPPSVTAISQRLLTATSCALTTSLTASSRCYTLYVLCYSESSPLAASGTRKLRAIRRGERHVTCDWLAIVMSPAALSHYHLTARSQSPPPRAR